MPLPLAVPARVPGRPRRLAIATVVAGLLTAALVLLVSDRGVNLYDEGIILVGAWRVALGDWPHRDFYANYGPAQFQLLAWLFEAFGPSVLANRLLDAAIRGAIGALLFAMLAPRAGPLAAGLATLGAAAWFASVGNAGYPVYGAILAMLVSTALLVRASRGDGGVGLFAAAGVSAAIAAAFRYDMGFLVACAGLVALAVMDVAGRRPGLRTGALAFAAGAGLPVAALLAVYAAVGAWPGFWHDIVSFPTTHYAAMRALPFPPLQSMGSREGFQLAAIVLPVPVAALGLAAVATRWRDLASRGPAAEGTVLLLVLSLATLAFYSKGLVRTSVEHMQPALIPSFAIAALLAAGPAVHGATRLAAGVLGVALLGTAASAVDTRWPQRFDAMPWPGSKVAATRPPMEAPVDEALRADRLGPAGSRRAFLVDPDRWAAARLLRAELAPDEPTFVGAGRHDKVFVNDVSAYFIARRRPATHWHHYDPGLQTSEPVQRAMVAELEAARPRLIWLESTFDGANEPNASAISSGVRVLDDYLRERYVERRRFGSIVIAERRPTLPAPAPRP